MNAYRVWIEEGCVACGVCAHYCPDVFCLQGESRVRGEAREDGVTDGNYYRKSIINANLRERAAGDIADVVLDCPMQVVRWERVEQPVEVMAREPVLTA